MDLCVDCDAPAIRSRRCDDCAVEVEETPGWVPEPDPPEVDRPTRRLFRSPPQGMHQCTVCGASFASRWVARVPKYCSSACNSRAAHERTKADGRQALWAEAAKASRLAENANQTCEQCRSAFSAKVKRMYCSKNCSRKADRGRAAERGACHHPDCIRGVVARGLCSTHYNRTMYTPEQRNPKVVVECRWCGHDCVKDKGREKRYGDLFCSVQCAGNWRSHLAGNLVCAVLRRKCDRCGRHWSDASVRTCPRGSCVRMERREPPPKPPRLFTAGHCADCSKPFVARTMGSVGRYCSDQCQRRVHRRKRKAREFGAYGTYTWTEVMRVFLLFDRCCAYCTVRIDGQPEPDHVIALARGGHNTIGNILPACPACNSHKRDLSLSEWAED